MVGVVAMVTHGIHREQRRYEEARRYHGEHGNWGDPDPRGHFIPDVAPDGVSLMARGFNGLYVRRPSIRQHDAEMAMQA